MGLISIGEGKGSNHQENETEKSEPGKQKEVFPCIYMGEIEFGKFCRDLLNNKNDLGSEKLHTYGMYIYNILQNN